MFIFFSSFVSPGTKQHAAENQHTGGGEEGGRIVAQGTPEQIAGCGESLTGRYLR